MGLGRHGKKEVLHFKRGKKEGNKLIVIELALIINQGNDSTPGTTIRGWTKISIK